MGGREKFPEQKQLRIAFMKQPSFQARIRYVKNAAAVSLDKASPRRQERSIRPSVKNAPFYSRGEDDHGGAWFVLPMACIL